MKFEVYTVRNLGRAVPRWQWATRPKVFGVMIVQDKMLGEYKRMSRLAHLIPDGHIDQPGLKLFDAQLVWASSEVFVMCGIEIVESMDGHKLEYAQTWHMTPEDRIRTDG